MSAWAAIPLPCPGQAWAPGRYGFGNARATGGTVHPSEKWKYEELLSLEERVAEGWRRHDAGQIGSEYESLLPAIDGGLLGQGIERTKRRR